MSAKSGSVVLSAVRCGLIALSPWMPCRIGFLAAQTAVPAPQAVAQSQVAPPATLRHVGDLLRQGKDDEAITFLQNEIKSNPNNLGLQAALGNTAIRVKRYDLAIATLQEAIRSGSPAPKAVGDLHLRLGEAYRRQGNFDAATDNLSRAKQLLPDNIIVLNVLATALDEGGHYAEAERELEAALALEPDNLVVLTNLANHLYEHGGSLDRALALAQQAREHPYERNSDIILPQILDTIGRIQLKRNNTGDAIVAFRDAVQRASSNPLFHYHLGMALGQQGDKAEAIRELKTALTLDASPKDRDQARQLLDVLQR
jgi:Flp pilus assembly protein TadD